MKPKIVLSAVNLFQAGPLSVYQDALAELAGTFADQYNIVALVHRKDLFSVPGVEFIEFPKIRASWIRRVKFEYYDLFKISQTLDAYLWLSLHDMTPRVRAKIQAVYCHNPAPFSQVKLRDVFYDWRYSAFALFYRHLYRLNIHRNNFVIVQQAWMRDRFQEMYSVKNVIVAHPKTDAPLAHCARAHGENSLSKEKFQFFYPAFPRVFKNIELLLQAAEILKHDEIEIWLTFSGETGRYARNLARKCRDLPNVKLLGRLTREQVFARYDAADCLVFPSRLETWGLPLSEFKRTGKPMLAADLPYARETVGTYKSVHFFDPENPEELASLMRRMSLGDLKPTPATAVAIASPFAKGWRELFDILLHAECS